MCFGRDGDWGVLGLLILGGRGAAKTLAVGMPALIRFLDENGLAPHRTVLARNALTRHHARPNCDYEHDKCARLRGIDGVRSIDTRQCYREPPVELLPIRSRTSMCYGSSGEESGDSRPALCIGDLFRRFKGIREWVQSKVPRLLVLPDPGGGKTALLDWLAYRCCALRLPWPTHLIPARFRLSDWQAHGSDLPSFLETHYRQRVGMCEPSPPTADRWRERLLDGSVLLLMDGLDKIAPDPTLDFQGRFEDLPKHFPDCPMFVTCRTLDYQKVERWLRADQFSLLLLDGLSLEQQFDYIDHFPAPFDKSKLKRRIENSPELVSLLGNPLLLMIVCSVVAEAGVPSTRAELYDMAIDKLLFPVGNPWHAPNGGLYALDEVRHWLEELALELIATGDGGDGYGVASVQSALQRILDAEVAGDTPAVSVVLNTYVQHGVIGQDQGSGRDGCRYRFRHSALQEYLAASALAGKVNEQGLRQSFELAGMCNPLSDWLERLSWDPNGQELLIFTVAQHPPDAQPRMSPRDADGLTAMISRDGRPMLIQDVKKDTRVGEPVNGAGFRSLAAVRLPTDSEYTAVLTVYGRHKWQFTRHDLGLLVSLGEEGALALLFGARLLKHTRAIRQANARLGQLPDRLRYWCQEIKERLGYDSVNIQLVRNRLVVIETVWGIGEGYRLVGLKHRLDAEKRDIQVDIAKSDPPRAELIRGWDPRFHPWIFHRHSHDKFERIWLPLVLVRNASHKPIEDWMERACWREEIVRRGDGSGRRNHRYVLELPDLDPHRLEIIGTLEVSVLWKERRIDSEDVQTLLRLSGEIAHSLYEVSLSNVLRTVAEQAKELLQASAAAVHFSYDKATERYNYEEACGDLPKGVPDKLRPRPDGQGMQAVETGQPIIHPSSSEPDDVLKEKNPQLWKLGVMRAPEYLGITR